LRLDFEFSVPDANQPARDKPSCFFDLDRLTRALEIALRSAPEFFASPEVTREV
jgi:hypothetical protein